MNIQNIETDILEAIKAIRAIKKKDFIYPTEPVENPEKVIGEMSEFELQLFTAISRLSEEHLKMHSNANKSIESQTEACIKYSKRLKMLQAVLEDSIAQRISFTFNLSFEIKEGGKIERIDHIFNEFFLMNNSPEGPFIDMETLLRNPKGEA
jgi:hypothetical protein